MIFAPLLDSYLLCVSVRQNPLDAPAHFSTGRHNKDKKWSFVESLKKDARLGSQHSEKMEFLRQIQRKKPIFQSAFTGEGDSDPPSKGASPFSPMGDITVDPKWVAKLLDELHVLFFLLQNSKTALPGVMIKI